ncbi:MAG: MgtC/SapB family protein [Terrisporobacter sp.]|uniref:MgtC/SapB family protein n=1 Tax=Terrisporobacter sp. TaxID=1965305 RepID=UPI002FCA91A0
MWDILLNNGEVIVKLLLAVVVGGFTGLEREKSNQFAGFRTHILVCIGSCVTSIIGLQLFNQYSGVSNMDPARLPAQVLSGIGFLGAGAILKNSNGIRGLTTAAGIWTTACIGIAIGYGQYVLGITAWALVLATLYLLKKFDKVIKKSQTILKATIFNLDDVSVVFNKIKTYPITIKSFQIEGGEENTWYVNFLIEYDKKNILDQLVEDLKKIDNVIYMDYLK